MQRQAAIDLPTKGQKEDQLFPAVADSVGNTCSPTSQAVDKEELVCLCGRGCPRARLNPSEVSRSEKSVRRSARPTCCGGFGSGELTAFPGGGWQEALGLLLSAGGAPVCDTPLWVRLELCGETVLCRRSL